MQSQSITVMKATLPDGELKLIRSVSHRYGFTKSGRGTIKTAVRYSVYFAPTIVTGELMSFYYDNQFGKAKTIFNRVLKLGIEMYNVNALINGEGV